jgi:hypothetical protein
VTFDYAKEISSLSEEQRLLYYELLAHNLTVSIRGVWLDENLTNAEKLDRIKLVNEILHRITSKIQVLRLNTHEWTEENTWAMINEYISDNEGISGEIYSAIKQSYRYAVNN